MFATRFEDPSDAGHLRICGQAGIGKTRLVLESLQAEDLAPLVAYYRNAREYRDDGLRTALLREDSDILVILVVDDCDSEDSVEYWNSLRRLGRRVKFVSLYQEVEQSSGSTVLLEPERLDESQISAILEGYGIEKPDAARWAPECDGSPRVAHIFGQNL
jgi:hypothetical protein